MEEYAIATFDPQPDIDIYELTLLIKLILSLNFGPRQNRGPKISFWSESAYDQFCKEFTDVMRNFKIEFRGKGTPECE